MLTKAEGSRCVGDATEDPLRLLAEEGSGLWAV